MANFRRFNVARNPISYSFFFFQINFHIVSKSATSYMSNEEHACRPQSVITEHNVSH